MRFFRSHFLHLHLLRWANTSLGHQVTSPPFQRSSVACPQHDPFPTLSIQFAHLLDLSESCISHENVFLLTCTWVQRSHSLCPYPVPFTAHPSHHLLSLLPTCQCRKRSLQMYHRAKKRSVRSVRSNIMSEVSHPMSRNAIENTTNVGETEGI
jgi:hypothetical protein